MIDAANLNHADIQTVTIVGLGALGTLFGHILAQNMPAKKLRVLADPARIARYQQEGVYSNGEPCQFHYVSTNESVPPADLILVAVKYGQLPDALVTMRSHVGHNTLILSLLNGIISEHDIAAVYGREKVVDCMAFGMDAVKEGNRLTFRNAGKLCIGTTNSGLPTAQVRKIARFFEQTNFPHEVSNEMAIRMWGKFMLNVGVNQTLAAFGPDYHAIQVEGEQRSIMIAAMQEVVSLANHEGVLLTQTHLQSWVDLLSTLNPLGKPSMRQDVEAKRSTELGLFAGTVIAMAKKHNLDTPVNRMLFERIQKIESQYPD